MVPTSTDKQQGRNSNPKSTDNDAKAKQPVKKTESQKSNGSQASGKAPTKSMERRKSTESQLSKGSSISNGTANKKANAADKKSAAEKPKKDIKPKDKANGDDEKVAAQTKETAKIDEQPKTADKDDDAKKAEAAESKDEGGDKKVEEPIKEDSKVDGKTEDVKKDDPKPEESKAESKADEKPAEDKKDDPKADEKPKEDKADPKVDEEVKKEDPTADKKPESAEDKADPKADEEVKKEDPTADKKPESAEEKAKDEKESQPKAEGKVSDTEAKQDNEKNGDTIKEDAKVNKKENETDAAKGDKDTPKVNGDIAAPEEAKKDDKNKNQEKNGVEVVQVKESPKKVNKPSRKTLSFLKKTTKVKMTDNEKLNSPSYSIVYINEAKIKIAPKVIRNLVISNKFVYIICTSEKIESELKRKFRGNDNPDLFTKHVTVIQPPINSKDNLNQLIIKFRNMPGCCERICAIIDSKKYSTAPVPNLPFTDSFFKNHFERYSGLIFLNEDEYKKQVFTADSIQQIAEINNNFIMKCFNWEKDENLKKSIGEAIEPLAKIAVKPAPKVTASNSRAGTGNDSNAKGKQGDVKERSQSESRTSANNPNITLPEVQDNPKKPSDENLQDKKDTEGIPESNGEGDGEKKEKKDDEANNVKKPQETQDQGEKKNVDKKDEKDATKESSDENKKGTDPKVNGDVNDTEKVESKNADKGEEKIEKSKTKDASNNPATGAETDGGAKEEKKAAEN